MNSPHRRGAARPLAALLVAAVVAALLVLVPSSPATAAPWGKVRGFVVQNGTDKPRVRMLWFDRDWTYLGARVVKGGVYSISLPAGRYHLQFVDLRPAYDVTKSAPADVSVTVRAGRTAVRNVRMRRGAAIGGVVRAGGKVAAGAKVVAANANEQSYTTTANSRGEYALGGLPAGSYSIFTYDRRKTWVDRSVYLRKVALGTFRRVDVALRRKAGTMLIDVYAGDRSYPGRATVTLVSRATGQFWVARLSRGAVTVSGLHPGGYDLVLPGTGIWLGDRVRVRGKVRAGGKSFGSAGLRKRGGWVSGAVVDAFDPAVSLAGARVRLYDSSGALRDTASTGASGRFTLDGALTTGRYTVVVDPGTDSGGYLGREPRRCLYTSSKVSGVGVTTGRGTEVGEVQLTPSPGQQKCPDPALEPVL